MLAAPADHHHRVRRGLHHLAEALLEPLARGDVDDGREHHRAFVRFDRVEPDLDRKFAAVSSSSRIDRGRRPWGATPGLTRTSPQVRMIGAEARRHEHLDRLLQHLLALIAEQRSAWALTISILPSLLIITIALGADSTTCRKRSSSLLREEMSTMAESTIGPSSVSIGLSPISIGNSLPSLLQAVQVAAGAHGARYWVCRRMSNADPGWLCLKRGGTEISIGCSNMSLRS